VQLSQFLSFQSIDSFLEDCSLFPKEAVIYVDSDLGPGIKGELESKKIHDLGFPNINLCTSFTDIDLSRYQWLKRIISKRPPF
jgi:hypothetical protein